MHDRFRKLIAPYFTNTAVLKLESGIQEYLDSFVRALRAEEKSVDMNLYCKYFTIDVSSLGYH